MLKNLKQSERKTYKIDTDHILYHGLATVNKNRDVKDRDVQKIQKSMSIQNLLKYRPILVLEDGTIYDGQHRYEAAKNLGLPLYVMFISKEDAASTIMISLNTNQTNWGLPQFANYWAKQTDNKLAKKIYSKFLEYKENNLVTNGILIALFNRQHSRAKQTKNSNEAFKNGRMPFNRDFVEDILAKFRQLKTAAVHVPIQTSTLKKQQFQQALLYCLSTDCFSFDKFVKNLCRSRHQLNKLAKEVDIRAEIVRIESRK